MYTLKIERDADAQNPRDVFDNAAVMVCGHRKYNLGDEQIHFGDWEEFKESLNAAVILPLYLYDHSGLSISTTPFNDRWDSGQIGYIYMTADTMAREQLDNDQSLVLMHSEVEEYNQYLNGDVWGYVITDSSNNVVDSCCGFYGMDYCEEEGQHALNTLNEELRQRRHVVNKTLIELIRSYKTASGLQDTLKNAVLSTIKALLKERKELIS